MIEIFTDAACYNAVKGSGGNIAIAIVIIEDRKVIRRISKLVGIGHTSCAEYLAIINALKNVPVKYSNKDIFLYSDNKSIVEEINLYSPAFISLEAIQHLKPSNSLLLEVVVLKRKFKNLNLKWIDRSQNEFAHQLALNASKGFLENTYDFDSGYENLKYETQNRISINKNMQVIRKKASFVNKLNVIKNLILKNQVKSKK